MSEVKKPQVSDTTLALAADLKAVGKVNSDNGVAEFDGYEDIFAKHMPAGQTIDSHKEHHDFLLTAAAAVTLAHGELQQDSMVENKDQQKGSTKVSLGHSSIEASYDRERSGTAMGKPWKNYGVAKTDVIIGTGRQRGEYNKVVNYLGDSAKSVFDN